MATPDAGERNPGERLRDLEAMLDAITDYEIIKLDVDGNVASWSPGAEALTGYSAAEAIGRPASIFSSEEDQAAGLVEQAGTASGTSALRSCSILTSKAWSGVP